VAGGKRVVEAVKDAPARQHEVPRLAAIGVIVAAEKTGFIVGDRFAEAVVECHGVWVGVVEVHDVDVWQELPHRQTKIGIVLGDEVVV
jgi:hypothetical protein